MSDRHEHDELHPSEPATTLVVPSDHKGSDDALHAYLAEWGFENSMIPGFPLFLTRKLNEERPRLKTTDVVKEEEL